jgi:hypothetical protein
MHHQQQLLFIDDAFVNRSKHSARMEHTHSSSAKHYYRQLHCFDVIANNCSSWATPRHFEVTALSSVKDDVDCFIAIDANHIEETALNSRVSEHDVVCVRAEAIEIPFMEKKSEVFF